MKTIKEKINDMPIDELRTKVLAHCANAVTDVVVSIASIDRIAKEDIPPTQCDQINFGKKTGYDEKEISVTRYLRGRAVLVDCGVWEEEIEKLYNQAEDGKLNTKRFQQIRRRYSI
ncbi:MAG: hypothetical protein AABW47_03390 [Nanoarchaeota archaeon]